MDRNAAPAAGRRPAKGSSALPGEFGENGLPSHGQTADQAPRRVRDCARENGFRVEAPQEYRTCGPDCIKTIQRINETLAMLGMAAAVTVYIIVCS